MFVENVRMFVKNLKKALKKLIFNKKVGKKFINFNFSNF
jgi:hypothetical protein